MMPEIPGEIGAAPELAATAASFALGAWLDRDLTGGAGIIAFIAAFAALIGMRVAARRSAQLTVGLLGAFGLLIGLAVAPVLPTTPAQTRALWQAGGGPSCSSPPSAPRATPPTAT